MALREGLARRAQPFLEPGEQVQAIFNAQSGASPYWSVLSSWIVILTAGYVSIAVTDRAVVVLRNGRFLGSRPNAFKGRFPRQPFGDPSGIWGRVEVGGTRYWVHRRYHKDIREGNAAILGTPNVA
jgi:hypothetical protein